MDWGLRIRHRKSASGMRNWVRKCCCFDLDHLCSSVSTPEVIQAWTQSLRTRPTSGEFCSWTLCPCEKNLEVFSDFWQSSIFLCDFLSSLHKKMNVPLESRNPLKSKRNAHRNTVSSRATEFFMSLMSSLLLFSVVGGNNNSCGSRNPRLCV